MSSRAFLGILWILAAGLCAYAVFLFSGRLLFVLPAGLGLFGVVELRAGRAQGAEQGRIPPGLAALAALTALLTVAALHAIFAMAPVEEQMGIVQKIFYFHVPSAYAMYVGFAVATVGSVGFLWRRTPRWDALAVAGAEVGLLFCTIVLVTGPLWARKAWGVYWTWDPRLTTTLFAGLIFMAFVVLRSFGGGEAEKRFASGLSVVGFALLPIIHFSVQVWRGQHPTVISRGGGGLHPDMVPALVLSFVLFTLLVALLVWARARVERLRQGVAALETEAASVGLLEES